MKPKKAEWNDVIAIGCGRCGVCGGSGKDPTTWRDSRCSDCDGSGECRHCSGNGVTRDGWHCGRCRSTGYSDSHKKYYESVGQYTPLQEVLDAISDRAIAGLIEGESDALREAFLLSNVTVLSIKEYEDLLSSYNEWMRSGSSYWLCMSYTRDGTDGCMAFIKDTLAESYGDLAAAYMAAKSGEAGGTKAQLDLINSAFKKRWAKSHIETTLNYFKWEAKERLLGEYISESGQHIPQKWQGRRPPLLTWDFAEILVWHATVLEPALRAEAERA